VDYSCITEKAQHCTNVQGQVRKITPLSLSPKYKPLKRPKVAQTGDSATPPQENISCGRQNNGYKQMFMSQTVLELRPRQVRRTKYHRLFLTTAGTLTDTNYGPLGSVHLLCVLSLKFRQ
jgi:hypothetical protein